VGQFERVLSMAKLTVREVSGHWNFFVSKCGRVFRKNSNGVLKEKTVYVNAVGYPASCSNLVHRMMAFAYLGEPPSSKHIVCHHNDVKTDNRLENLYWGTRKQNEEDKTVNGGRPVGEEHVNCVLTEKQVLDLRQEYLIGTTSYRKLAAKHGIHYETIRDAILGITWTHLTEFVDECQAVSDSKRNSTSEEAKKRINYYLKNTSFSKSRIARMFKVDKSTVCRMAKKLH
jgi:hypothetical protein